ncbi:TolC family protein [Planctomycetota bacterium]
MADQAPFPGGVAADGFAVQSEPYFTLADAIQLAFDSSPDLRSAEERTRIADAILARARSEFYPQLSVSEAYGVTNNPVNVFSFLLNQAQFSLAGDLNHPPTTDDFHTQVLLQHGVYAGGRRKADTCAAMASRSAAGFSLAAAQNELVFRVAEAYYRAFQARELVSVRGEAVSQVERHLEIVRSRERAGTAVKSDVLIVEVRLAEVQEARITSRNQEELGWAVLENVCGAPIHQRNLPEEIPAAPWSDRVDQVETAVAEAQSRRPEIGELASQMRAAGHNVRAARAGKYPMVDFVADYDVFTGDFARGNDSWYVGLVARLTLFDGARTRNDVCQATAKLRELQSRRQRLLLDIELGVRRTYLQLNDARERLEVATRAVAQAQETLREIEVRYRGQSATITQLVDAQVALSNARVRRNTARAEIEIARAALEKSTGRLREVLDS